MKDTPVADNFKIVQIFLPQNNSPMVYEVSSNEKNFRCTCPIFDTKKHCKHVSFVVARIDANGGKNYPLEISNKATLEDAQKAQESIQNFREFIIKFGKVEVI
jgi:hypothetical protein